MPSTFTKISFASTPQYATITVMKQLLKIYWFALAATIIIWVSTGIFAGWQALLTVVVLTLLEVTFSADNAVINSKIITSLSPLWQKLFMTLGIIIAVFAVRFAMPIAIVAISAKLSLSEVVNLALNSPSDYEHYLSLAEPAINAFGGAFLLMIALSYFIDHEKQTHWLKFLEHRLGKLGKFNDVTIFIMLLASIILYFTVSADHQGTILIASICAMALKIGLNLLEEAFSKNNPSNKVAVRQVYGMAAFASFLYLELLDASFSLDGVIGAFALTNNIILIMAGLGAGAVWVRAMTIHLVKNKTLAKYQYLEHGAHWAIGFLGGVMMLKLYGVELPEWLVGSLGIVFIGLAIATSIMSQRDIKS